MKRTVPAAALLLFGLMSCAGPGGVSPRGGLRYELPQPTTLTYVMGDTTDIEIEAGSMGTFAIRQTIAATLAMAFADGAGGFQVTTTFQELAARRTDPMGGAETASQENIVGDLVFSMDPRGNSELVTLPEMRGGIQALFRPTDVVYDLLPGLPGGAVNPGDSWTDTVSYVVPLSPGERTSSSVLTYTLQGDTTVAGTNLLLVTYEGTIESSERTVNQQMGAEMVMKYSGSEQGMFLWDAARGVAVGGDSRGEMEGATEIPAAGMPPMPMRLTNKSHFHLQGS